MTLKEALNSGKLLVSDGGIGTQLQQLGLEPGGCGDEWNLTHPEHVATVHRRYLDAGSQVITTNTFGANAFVLANYGLQDRQAELARAGAEIAKGVVSGRGWVMGSVGPCGGFLEPLGDVNPAALERSLHTQITALLEGGADAILLETLTALEEIELSVRVARALKSPCVIVTAAFDPTKDGPRTMMGVTPENFARTAVTAGADVVGANCGTLAGSSAFIDLARRLRSATTVPLLIQPNGGQPSLEDDRIVYRVSPEQMAETLAEIGAHVNIVGGCCGTAPAHISALRSRLEATKEADS